MMASGYVSTALWSFSSVSVWPGWVNRRTHRWLWRLAFAFVVALAVILVLYVLLILYVLAALN